MRFINAYENKLFQLGIFYEIGYGGVEIDKEKSFELFKKSSEKGSLNGCSFYGYRLLFKNDHPNEEEGLKLIEYSCKNNSASGINIYGHLFFSGLSNFEEDIKKAFRFYKKAAELGSYLAMCNVGMYYRDGILVQEDLNIAIKCFEMTLSFGSSNAAFQIAKIYSDYNFPSVFDADKARFYFKLAMDYGCKDALCEYCCFLLQIYDEDVEKNMKKTVELRELLEYGRKIKDFETMRLQAAFYFDGGVVYEMNQLLAVEILNECAASVVKMQFAL